MISKAPIFKELKKMEALYDAASRSGDLDLQKFYSKLVILELCGWIEQNIDYIVGVIKKRLKNGENIRYVENLILKTYSFSYKEHFKPMLIKTVGILRVEKIEKQMDANKKNQLEISLDTLKKIRDEHAHTCIPGTTSTFYAPSFTLSFFDKIYYGLKDFEKEIRQV